MDTDRNQHLEPSQLARLLEQSRQRLVTSPDLADLHPHLAACWICRQQYEEAALLDRQLKALMFPQSASRQSDCPAESVWREIAGGVTPLNATLASIKHASECDHCGPLLRAALAELSDLNGQLTDAERRHIVSLESAQTEWQQKLAQQIARTPGAKPDHGFWFWRQKFWQQKWLSVPQVVIAGASLLALVVAAAWFISSRPVPATAERLLARAYSQTRTVEFRIAGASYAPLNVSRGQAASFTNRPPTLLQAEALIADQLQSHPTDPSWLQATAQADILEGKYDVAVEALRHALQLEPHSAPVMIDLATAYSQRALQEDRKEDFGAAYEYLSQALKLRPEDPVALFNRAIVSEHQFLYHQALDDWEHYLRLDSNSPWADEARTRANAVRETLKKHESQAKPLLSPAEVAIGVANPSLTSEVDQRIEEYLHEAVVSWLPQAFPEADSEGMNPAPDQPAAAQALFFLADLTSRNHHDHWLADLLRGSSARHFPRAVAALARASTSNKAGNYDGSTKQSNVARQLFRASGNAAGVLRAQFAQTLAAQMARKSDACRHQASAALAESGKYSYSWLQIQFALEEGVCSGLMGDLGAYQRVVQQAMDHAQEDSYGALYLRAVGLAADYELATGNQSAYSKLANAGLKEYWSAQYPVLRGYNLYTELSASAEAGGRSNLELSIWREAVSLIDSEQNLLQRALAHNQMANAAAVAHSPQVAKRQYADAARLFAAAPATEATRTAALETEVRTAQVESHLSQFDEALARLTGIQDQIRSLSNNYLVQMFYTTLGEVQLGLHHAPEAEEALTPALDLAEQSLATLKSDAEKASWSKNAAPAYLALVEAKLEQGHSQEALDAYEWYLGASQRSATDPQPHQAPLNQSVPDASRLASRLPLLTRETVLTYAVLPDGLAIWVYDNRNVNSRWIPKSTDELQELAERFNGLCSDPKSEVSALQRDARSLYEWLIAPVEESLAPDRTLVIEADGWLGRVPFEALLDSNHRYEIEYAPIVYSLGNDSENQLHSDPGISLEMPALVVGSTASSAADGLIPIPDITAEADAVASHFRSVRELKGGEATLDAVQNELPKAAVFHFAGHSLSTVGRTGLLLKADGEGNPPRLMDAAAVGQLPLQNLQLAVLSACSTASGSGGAGGFDSVTGALLRKSVPHVVASRWAVDSAVTRGFVQDFYRNALSGKTVSDSIHLTALHLLARQGTSHPYYWSAFAAYGRP